MQYKEGKWGSTRNNTCTRQPVLVQAVAQLALAAKPPREVDAGVTTRGALSALVDVLAGPSIPSQHVPPQAGALEAPSAVAAVVATTTVALKAFVDI